MERLAFFVLGPLEARCAGRPVPLSGMRERAVLAALLLAGGRVVPIAALIDAAWDGQPPSRADKAVRNVISALRRQFAETGHAGLIETSPAGYRLTLAGVFLDAVEFEQQVAAARALAAAGQPQLAVGQLRGALRLWRGPALAGIGGPALEGAAARLAEQRLAALEDCLDLELELGRHHGLVGELRALTSEWPLRERPVTQLMLALYRSGRQAEALDTYHRLTKRLADDLGLDPCRTVTALHEAILRQDPALTLASLVDRCAGLPSGVTVAFGSGAFPVAAITGKTGRPGNATPETAVAADPALAPEPAQGGAPRPRPAQLPLDVSGFTGRVAELAALHALLRAGELRSAGNADQLGTAGRSPGAGQPSAMQAAAGDSEDCRATGPMVLISAIGGTAGVGKTALAVRFAHQVADRFPDGQLYVNLRGFGPSGSPVAAEEALRGFLYALGVAVAAVPANLDVQAGLYRSLLAGRRMLVLLDNAADEAQVRPLLPGSPACLVLVTSRRQLTGLAAAEGANPLTLDVLTEEEAHGLLARRLGEQRLTGQREAAGELVRLCAWLPLALAIVAGRAAARPDLPLSDLAAGLREAVSPLDALQTEDPATDLRAVFSWSLRGLPPATARLFVLLGLHSGPDVDAYAAAALDGSTVQRARRDLDQLTRARLIQSVPSGRYTMHDLLRAYAVDLATAPGRAAPAAVPDADECRAALQRLLDYYLATAVAAMERLNPAEAPRRPRIPHAAATPMPGLPDAKTAVAWLDTERPCLVAGTAYAAGLGWHDYVIRLSATLSRYLQGGHSIDALAIHSHALDAARQAVDRRGEAEALRQLGGAYWRLGQYEQAVGRLEQALALCKNIGDRTGQARMLDKLGTIYRNLGETAAAMRYQEQALALFRQADEPFGEAAVLNNLGDGFMRLGRSQEAAACLWEALALFRQAGVRDGEAHALNTLGEIEQRSGRAEQAAEHFRQALGLFTELGYPVGEAHALASLGTALTSLGQPEEAAAHHRRALALAHAAGNRGGEAFALNGLGEAAQAAGHPADAVTHHTAALSLALDTGDREHQARAHLGLSHACDALRQPASARDHLRHALTLYADLGYHEAEQIRAQLAAWPQTHPAGSAGQAADGPPADR